MNLKTHIRYSFLAILALFALNFSINFWSAQQKGVAMELLHQEISRQALTTTIKQGVSDIQTQVVRLGQIHLDGTITPLAPSEIEQFNLRSTALTAQFEMLNKLSDAETHIRVDTLRKRYAELTASWRIFYENFGVNHNKALTELALHIEPLSQHVLFEAVPPLEKFADQRIETAHQQLEDVQWWTNEIALITFLISLCVTFAIAVQAYLRMIKGLDTLKQGALLIGEGEGKYRIAKQSDEFGEIADSINNLSDALNTSKNLRASLEQEQAGFERERVSLERERTGLERELLNCRAEIEDQRQISKSLLLNILPAKVAEEFRMKGSVAPKYLEDVTIIFTDFVGFSSSAETLAAEDLVQMLHEYFSTFDEIAARYGLEKLKTIGDSYMCAGGLPERNPSHPVDAVMAAMEIVHAVVERSSGNQHHLSVRVGIHTGHVISGMVGKQKFSYDIWGESVNYASRVESSSEPDHIALSGQTYLRVKDFFECEKRSKINAKGAQNMELYFVNGFLPSLMDDSNQTPPAAFLRRYNSYFQKNPPSFPSQHTKYLASKALMIQDKEQTIKLGNSTPQV